VIATSSEDGIVQGAPKKFYPLRFSDNFSETAENF